MLLMTAAWLWAAPALAQEAEEDEQTSSAAGPGVFGETRRKALMEVNFRSRYMIVPDSVLDIWYFDEDDEGANPFKRPSARAYTVGIEYVLRPDPVNWIFYFEYIGNLMDEGYWDDVDEGAANHENGEWIRPNNFGAFAIGANGARELPLTNPEKDVWLSAVLGGGLGIAFIQGELLAWNQGNDVQNDPNNCPEFSDSAAYVRYEVCEPDETKRVPGILPLVDLSASAKINFGDRAHLRIEGGIHDFLFAGVAFGTAF
ncbi:MAG: hypothetical protein AAFV53_18605 [Myxococcota bacterium]